MTPNLLFYLLIGIVIFQFIKDEIISYLNALHFNDAVPKVVSDVFDAEEYQKSQAYKKSNYRFSIISNSFSIVLTLGFFGANGFHYLDAFIRSYTENEILTTLYFFGFIVLASDLLTTPFSYYQTFVIEEKFGFNKSTPKLFFIDKLKGWLLMLLLGGLLLALITWFYQQTGNLFWLYTWLLLAVFTIFINLFYSSVIVPLFNKQKPLEDGTLKTKLEEFANKVGFQLDQIFVIDGSKRSTKANAYFSGFGPKKRIVLYDTLINDLSEEEIVAVFAHEVGHYKRKHTIYNLVSSLLLTGLTLFLLSLLIGNPILASALQVSTPSFHIGLIVFSILYSPISEVTGLFMNLLSRKFEYQADDYAKEHTDAKDLVSGLKKLSKNSLSNLTPHSATVFLHYSHPPLKNRIENLLK